MTQSLVLATFLLGALAGPLLAQNPPRFELEFKGGVGGYEGIGARGTAGAGACLLCSGNLGVFTEYTHWTAPGARSAYAAGDSFSLGLRLQTKASSAIKARPYLDVGLATGRVLFSSRGGSRTGTGLTIGGGVLLPVTPRFYFRPQLRTYSLSNSIAGLSAEIGIGYRF